MKLTNKLNLPEAIVAAIANDPYSKGDCHFSVTELLQPPRARALKIKHAHELQEDVSDRLWALYGQVAHTILERANLLDLSEKRFFAEINGVKISGQIDTLAIKDGVLSDYKFTTSWGFKTDSPPKPEWISQLNMQAHILRLNDIVASKLQIVGLLRDWQIREAQNNPGYPQAPIAVIDIPMWSAEQTEAFINERVSVMRAAEVSLPLCTASERWAKNDTYAVMKKGVKRAHSLQYSIDTAEKMAKDVGGYVQFRAGESTRCKSYCNCNIFCGQYQDSIKNEV